MKKCDKTIIIWFFIILVFYPLFVHNPIKTIHAEDSQPTDWWNSAWKYRRSLVITENSGNSLHEYPIKCTLDTESLIAAGKMKEDSSDIRVINASSGEEIPWAIDTPNSPVSNITLKIPTLGANQVRSEIYLYYGNPASQSTPNDWNDVYYNFWEDFDQPVDWSVWTNETFVDTRTNRKSFVDQSDTTLHVWSESTSYYGYFLLCGLSIRFISRLR